MDYFMSIFINFMCWIVDFRFWVISFVFLNVRFASNKNDKHDLSKKL